ncbi:MAG: DUF5685 family protein [Lachnospiraceae bacterium]|nr:DUF5685 family protein [Lachnospiraceae bacterium]
MFGYVTINQEELKIKDYNYYRSCYCGLCRSLKKRHGSIAPMTLSYDMTFLVILLSGLYETPFETGTYYCIAHPTKKQTTRHNKWSDYAADMTILLSYYNLMDDWTDDKKVSRLTMAKTLEKAFRKVSAQYPIQAAAVKNFIAKTSAYEAEKKMDLDCISGYTGEVLGKLFTKDSDLWTDTLYKVGFYLGKFIYLMDAFDDLEDDRKKASYNPLITLSNRKDFEATIENILILMMADCSREFEKLPIVQHVEILRNILYSGVWTKYDQVKAKKLKKGETSHE